MSLVGYEERIMGERKVLGFEQVASPLPTTSLFTEGSVKSYCNGLPFFFLVFFFSKIMGVEQKAINVV
jgi:hypothetical protein